MAETPRSPLGNLVALDVVDLHSSSNNSNININSDGTATGDGGVTLPVDLQCPATPHLNLKLPDLSSSSTESDEEIGVIQLARPTSPPPNCAICLGRCKNKCFTDSCMHQFCFKCLCEWSKVKPECPLCKQTFKSIIHNVKSIDQFEEYHVQPPAVPIPHPLEVTYRQSPYILDVLNNSPHLEVSLQGLRTVRTILYPSASSTGGTATATNGSNPGNIQNQFIHRGELLDMYRQEFPDAIASSGTLSQLWRRYVYDRKLYALPVCDITGRYRESNARFYRDNPAQIHRLMPWINRDIVCLLRNTEHDVSFVLERINEWLIMANILSPLFRRRLQPILGTKTLHFIHELNNFARSPYDMIGYDRAVQYSPLHTEEIVIEFSTSSSSAGSSDEEPVQVVDADNDGAASSTAATAGSEANSVGSTVSERRRPSHRNRNATQTSTSTTTASRSREYRMQSRAPMVNLLSFTISTTSEGVEAPGVTVAVNGRGSQSAAINLTTHNRAPSDILIDLDDPETETNPNAYTNNYTTSGNGSNSNTTQADGMPPSRSTAYTPAEGSLPSTTIQHVTPTVTENIELSSTSSDECEFVLERKPPHLRTPEMVSLNSESDSDVVFVDENRNNQMHYSTSEDEETKTKPPSSTSNVKQLRSLKYERPQSTNGTDPDYEYNVGASTSTGIRSSGQRTCRQKSISVEKKKLKKRTLRSNKSDSLGKSKRGGSNTTATSNRKTRSSLSSSKDNEMHFFSSSESEDDNKRPANDTRMKRSKRKSGDKRITKSKNEMTKEKNKYANRKRKHGEESENGDKLQAKCMRFNADKTQTKSDQSDDTDYSSTEDAYLSLNKLRSRLLALQSKEPDEQQRLNFIDQQNEENERNSMSNVEKERTLEGTLKNQMKKEKQMQNDSDEDEPSPPQRNISFVTAKNEDNENYSTANSSTTTTERAEAASNILLATSSSKLPKGAISSKPHQQLHINDTFSSETQTTSAGKRSILLGSPNSRSSGYTTTTTNTTTDFTSSTSSSSSSSSDDSDSNDDKNKVEKCAKNSFSNSTHKRIDGDSHNLESTNASTANDNINFDHLMDVNAPLYYFNTNAPSTSIDTHEAVTHEAAAALADFANNSFRLQLENANPELIQHLADMPIFSSDSEENNIADGQHNEDEM